MPTLREVYEKFKAAGAKMPDTYEEFDRFMTSGPNGGYTHRKEFYDKYKAIGAPLPETYEEFSRALFVPALGHGVPTYTEEQVAADLGRSQGGVTLDADAPSTVAPSGQGAGLSPGAGLGADAPRTVAGGSGSVEAGQGAGLAPGAGLGADAPRGVAGGSGSAQAGQGPGEGQATRSRRRTLDEVAPPSTMWLLPEGTEGQQGAQARQWAAVSEPGAQVQTPAQAPLAPEEAPVGPPRAQAQAPSELVSDKLYDFRNVVDGAPPTAEQKADASAHVAEVLSDFRSATSKPEPTFVEQMQARGQHTLRPGMAVSRYNPETKQTERVYPAADGRYYGTALQASLATAEYNKPANQVIRDLGAGDTSSLDGLIRDSYQGAVADIKGELSEQLRAAAKKPAISRTGVMGVDPELARAQSDYNAKMTLESLTSRVWSAIPEGVIQAYIRRDVLAALQADPDVSEATLDAIVQHSADGLADRIAKTIWRDADEWAKKEMGSASFVKQALLSTTPALLALGSMGDNIYKQALMQQSQAWGEEHPWQNAGAFAAGMLMDPTMYGYGFAAKGVAGAAIGGLGRRYMIRGLNKYAAERITADVARRYMLMRPLGQVAHKGIAGAANFAMFETGTEAAGQYARGEFDLGKLMLKPVTGAAKGALIGFGGGMVGNAFDKLARGASSTAEALALRAAGTGVSLGVESTVFAGADALLEGEDFGEAWLNAARTIIAMKAVNAAPHAITAVGEGVRNIRAPKTRAQQLSQKSLLQGIADRLANTPEASLTDTELAELKRYGYGDVSELLGTKPSSYREGADGRVEVDGRTYDNLAAMMGDSRVSETARAKMYYICTGKRVPMSTVSGYNIGEREVIGEDGKPTGEKIYYVDAMGQGGVISHREYTSQAAAERAAASVEGQAEVNAIVMGEEYAERVADTQQHEGAARVVRSAYASMQGQGMEMPATDRAMVEEYMRLKALEQGGAQSLTPEQSRFVADFDRALARLEGDYVLRRPESIRDDISREYGVDVDDAIRKPKGGRSESEQRAVEDYANRLYGREEGPVGEIGEGEQKVQTEGSGPDGPDGPDNPLEDARRQGSEAATEERQDIINRYKQAEEAWRKLGYLWTADEDNRPLDEVIDDLRQNGASDDDIDLCVEYYLANAAKNGVIDAMRHEADVRREMEIERVDRCVYRDDLLSMIPAEVDGRIVYITSGKVAVREDGTVDTAGSDQTITVCDPETGETRMVSPESIKCVYHSSDIRTKHREIRQNINSELQGEIDRLFSDEGPRADARGPLGADAPRGVAGNRDTGRADGRGGDDTAPDFSRAGEIVFTDAEGNEARGYITGHRDPETGQLEYYRAGERQLLYATDEELAAMVKEYKPDEPTPDEPTPVEPTPEVVARDSQGTELAVGDQVLQTAGRHAGARGVVEKVHPDGRVTVKYSDDNIITYDEQSGDITNTGLIKASADTDTSNPQPVLIDAAGREVKAGDTIAGPEGMTGKVTGEKYSESTYAVEWADGHVTGVNSDMLARYGYMVKDSVQDGAPDAAGINSEKEEIEKPSMDTKIEGLNEGERNVIGTITIYTSRGMAKEAKVCAKKTSDGFECEVRKDERVPVASYISIKRDMIDIVDFEESSNGDYLNKDDIANEDSGFSGILDIEDLQINKIFKNGHTGNRLAVIFRFKDGDFVSESCALLKEGVTIEDLLASHNSIMAETLKAKGLDPQLKDTVPKPPVIEESLENASTEASALARVPKDAEGRPRFEQAESAEDGWDGLVEHYAGDDFSLEDQEDMAREHAAKAIKEAQKRINDLPKLKQENGEDTRDYLMRKKRAEKAAKAELAAWEAIAKVKEQRAAQAAAAQAAAEAEAAAQAEAERQAAAQAAREKAAEEAAAQAEAAGQAAEAAKGVPNWTHDRPEDARARGYRMVNGEKVERQGALQVPMGEETDVAFTDRAGDTVKGHYAIVDLDKAPVQASHMQGERNPRYFIDEAQPKDRRDQASTMKAREHARDFSVDQALSSGTAYVGPVVINSRGEVVQGNGRRDMYEQLYGDTSNAQRAESYRQALMAQAARYGVSAEDIAQMGRPMAVRVIDVDDSEAIRLGQYTAQDTESGGIERLRPRNVAMQLGGDMRRFAEMLLRSEDDEESLSQLIDRNGAGVLQWMRDRRNADGSPAGVISATQYQSAFDSRGNLTGEAKNDLQKVLWQAAFAGADSYVEQVFGRLPAKAQRAILATAHRDLDSPKREQMLEDVQKSILAYGELMSDANFAKQTEMEALLRAIEEWKNATAISDTGEIETPSEKYSNFALHLAALYRSKEYTQRMLTRLMNDIYDLVQGTVIKEGQMDFGDVDTAPKPLRDAIREKLGIEYEPAKNSVKYGEETKDEPAGGGDVAQPNGAGAPGQPGGKAPHSGGKQTETGKGRTDGGGGAAGDGPGGVGPQPPKDGVGGPGRTADTVGGDGLPEGSGKIAQAQSQRVEAKPAEAAAVKGDGYMIEPKPYTNKQGKTLDTYLVRFDQAFTKDELSAMRSKARAIKGWYDRESGGWMLRSAEDARAFAEEVMNKTPQEIEDDKPLSLGDLRQATETGQAPQQTARPPEEDSAPEVKPKGKRKWVLEGDAAEFERLRERLRTHLQGPDEVREEEAGYGKARPARMDPEVLALGCQMSALLFKGGLRSYRDYCEAMIEEVGDAIRPHLKMLYNATRGLDDIIERGWDEEMDDLKTVRSFDELNFDRQTPEAPIETAMHIADTAESLSDGAAAVEEIKKQRNERRNAPEVQEAQAGYGSTVQSPRRRYKAQGPSLFDDAALGADAPSTVAPSGAIGRAGARGLLGADAPRGVAGGPGAAQAGLTAGAGQPTQAQRAAAELAEQKRQQAEMYRKLTPAQKSERSAEIDQEHQEVLLQIEEAGSTEQALAEGLSTLGDLWEQMAMMYGEEPTAPIPAARMVSIEADCRRIRQQLYQIAIADTSLRDELQGIEDEYLSIDYDPDRGHERSIARYNQSLERVLELQQRARHISEVHPDNADAPKTLALAQDLEGRIRRMIEDAKFDKERRDVVAQILGEEILEEQADPKEFERGPIWEPGRQVTINDIADAQWWAYRQTNDMAKRYRSSDGSRLELLEDREYGIDVCKQAIKLKQRRIKLLKELDATPQARRALDEAIRRQKEDIKIIRQWIKEGDGRGRDTRVSPLLSVSFRLLDEVNGRVESADVRTRLGETAETFEQRRQAAVRNRGTVMAGLNEAEVNVVHVPRHGYKGRNALTQAVDAAAKRYDGVTLKYENHGATFEYTITPRSLKYAANHSSNSENNGVHMAVMDKLDEVISESIEVMEHADVHKKDGVRSEDNGYNADTLMHRFVGAVNIDGKSYRVVTTLKEYSSDKNPGHHSYEVTKIEVLDAETPSTPNGTTTDGAASVEVAKLLNGCEIHNKTGKKILEESEQTSAQGKRVTAERMAESLGVTGRLTVVGDKEGLKGLDVYQRADAATRERMERAPGFYDHRTGQIVIVEGNNRDAEDIAATMLHETVAHHGLDALMGSAEAARELYDEIYDHLAEEERARVNERMHRSGYDSAKATEEYMGELAEKGFEDFDSTDRSIWQKFKDKVLAWLERLLSKAGVKLPDWVKLGDNELRYILWRSKQNLERRVRDRDRAGARGPHGADAPRGVAGGAQGAADSGAKGAQGAADSGAKGAQGAADSGGKGAQGAADSGGKGTAEDEAGEKMRTLGLSFRDPDDTRDIWEDQSLGMRERITNAALRLAALHGEDIRLRSEAMMAVADNLKDLMHEMRNRGGTTTRFKTSDGRADAALRGAAREQRRYDRTTVKRVSDLAKTLISSGMMGELTDTEIKRLLTAVSTSVSGDDIGAQIDKVIDTMVDSQLRESRNVLEDMLSTKGTKVNAQGVVTQGQLDPAGTETLRAYKQAYRLDEQTINERIAEAENRLSETEAAIAESAANQLVGLELALQHAQQIGASLRDEATLREELREASEQHKAGRLTKAAYEQLTAALHEGIRQSKVDRIEAYGELAGRTGSLLQESGERAKAWRQGERERVNAIHHYANSDMQGRSAAVHRKDSATDRALNVATSTLLSPLGTFEQVLRIFGSKSANGEGYLWNHYMRGWIRSRENEIEGVRSKYAALDAKAAEIAGKGMTWNKLTSQVSSKEGASLAFIDGSEMTDHDLTQGNLMYIYMVDKMLDGRMKLRKMGIDEGAVQYVTDKLDPRLRELADWLQDEFLPSARNEYNETHKRMYGASMAAVEHYFPLRIHQDSRQIDESVDNNDRVDTGAGTTVTGAIKKRVRNTRALDLTNTDAMTLVLDHIAEMEHWNAYAEWGRDLNTLLSYTRFRNQVKNIKSPMLGTGDRAWSNFKDLCRIAAGTYHQKTSDFDQAALSIARGVTAAKVSYRLNTALKQLLSMPAYIPEISPKDLVDWLRHPENPWKWCMENLPIFRERWESRIAGEQRLQKTGGGWNDWRANVAQRAARLGMTPNAFIDALTVSIGAYAMYKARKRQYLRDGYTESRAERLAKEDATILFNQSQQSSEGAFLSRLQANKDWLSTVFTVFRNSPMSYTRQVYDASRSLAKQTPEKRREMIAFMAKQYRRDGLEEAQAESAAKRKVNRQLWKDVLRVATYGFILPTVWSMGGYWLYYLLGSDSEEKGKMEEAVKARIATAPFEGLAGGDVISNVAAATINGTWNSTTLSKDMPVSGDISQIVSKIVGGKNAEAVNDIVNLVVQMGIGVNPQTLEDAALGIIEACQGDVELAHETAIWMAYVLNNPNSQVQKLYFDEVGLTEEEASKLTPQELAERYARAQVKRGRGLKLYWLWDNDEALGKAEAEARKRIRERLKRAGEREVIERYKEYGEIAAGVGERMRQYKSAMESDYVAAAEIWDEIQSEGESYRIYEGYKAADKYLEQMAKQYMKAATAEEAALLREGIESTRALAVEAIGERSEARANALWDALGAHVAKYGANGRLHGGGAAVQAPGGHRRHSRRGR